MPTTKGPRIWPWPDIASQILDILYLFEKHRNNILYKHIYARSCHQNSFYDARKKMRKT